MWECVNCVGEKGACVVLFLQWCYLIFASLCQIVVSHDQWFLKRVATQFWALDDGHITVYRDFQEAKKASYAQ